MKNRYMRIEFKDIRFLFNVCEHNFYPRKDLEIEPQTYYYKRRMCLFSSYMFCTFLSSVYVHSL